MARTSALGVMNDTNKAELTELYGELLEGVYKDAVSEQIKNKMYSSDKGAALDNKGKVTVNVNVDREIVEEIEGKDVQLFGVPDIIARRTQNHVSSMTADLDSAFFKEAETVAHAVTTAETDIEEVVEAVIQDIETTKNEFVDGVDRSQIVLTLTPNVYGKLRNHIDKASVTTADSGEEEIEVFHGVRVFSNTRQTAAAIAMVDGAIAQPVLTNEYKDEPVPLSNAHAVELFYSYGTKAVTPDLVAKLVTLPAKANFGYLSEQDDILAFMRDEVPKDDNWRVQEVSAKAFDEFCKKIGYKKALSIIDEWLKNNNPNARRAVVEGLHFKVNPKKLSDELPH